MTEGRETRYQQIKNRKEEKKEKPNVPQAFLTVCFAKNTFCSVGGVGASGGGGGAATYKLHRKNASEYEKIKRSRKATLQAER
jgi:hypothetical protein